MNRVKGKAEPVICVGWQNKGLSGIPWREGPNSNIMYIENTRWRDGKSAFSLPEEGCISPKIWPCLHKMKMSPA